MIQTYAPMPEKTKTGTTVCTRLRTKWMLLMLLFTAGLSTKTMAQSLVAGWDFETTTNGGAVILAAPNTSKIINANFGSGTIYLDGTNGSSNWIATTSGNELTAFGGAGAVNLGTGFSNTTSGIGALALVGGTSLSANGKSLVFKFNMVGKSNLVVSYASRNTTTGFQTQTWATSTDGINWTTIQSVTGLTTTYTAYTLTATNNLNGAANAYLRLTVTGATNATGNNRLDNIQLNANTAPTLTCGPIVLGTYCVSNDNGANISVPYSISATPGATNVFTVQLSNSSGSFSSPVNIGTLSSTATSGTIAALIPAGTASGTGYRVRVLSSDPVATGTDNGTDITVDKVVASASNSGPICAGLSLFLNASGGNAYSWTGPNGFNSSFQNPSMAFTTTADSGVYLVTAISTLGCTDTASTLAIVMNCGCIPPTTVGTATLPSCNGGIDGTINITVTGGVGPYTYLWNTGYTSEDTSFVGAGTYTVIVTDAVSCKDTFEITVGEPSAINLSFSVTQPGCQGYSNGSINLTVSGGTPGYTYLWDNGATTEDISGLAAGLYSVTVTDGHGCIQNGFGVVTDPPVFTISLTPTDVTCAGVNNGTINLTASNDTSSTNPGLLISEFLANPAGSDSSKEWIELIATKNIDFALTPYSVIVANNGTGTTKGWTAGGFLTYAFQISSGTVVPGEVVYVGGSNMAITGRKLRVIDVSTIGGDGGIGNASAGGFLGNGGANADGIAVFNLPLSAIDSNTVPVEAIFYGTGIGTALVNAGTDGYTLPVNDKYFGGRLQPTSYLAPDPTSLNVLATGTYNKLTGAYAPVRSWSATGVLTDGTSSVSVLTGNTFLWSNGSTAEDQFGLSAGTYTVTATTSTGCTATASATINAPTALSVTGTVFNVSCFGLNDGAIDINVSGGTSPYTYLWNDAEITEDRSTLVTGNYTVTVTDANGCTGTASFLVDQPSDFSYTTMVTNTSCFGASDGAIDLTLAGGTPPYSFSWSNGDTTEDISNQPANFYFFNVTDANGCSTGGLDFINDAPQVNISTFFPSSGGAGVQVTIYGSGFLGVTAVNFGSVPASSFTIVNDAQINAIVPFGADTAVIYMWTTVNCSANSTLLFYYDPVSCVPPSASALVTNPSCYGNNNGSIDVTVTGGIAPFTYSWSNGATTEDLTGLVAGTYTLVVTGSNSCPDTLVVTVTAPGELLLPGFITNASCNGSSDGSIDLTVVGGTAPFTIFWSTFATTEDISGLAYGIYTVTVTDYNGCAATEAYTISEPAVLQVTTSVTDPLCSGAASGAVSTTVTGGTPTYFYLWSNGANTPTISGVTAGTYTVTVADVNGCFASATATVTDPAPFTLSVVSSTDVSCFGGASGAIDIAASNDPAIPPANPGLLISEFLPDPTSTDNPFEWVELVATKSINFASTPYTVVLANNGTPGTKGWRAGGTITYALQISSGVVNPGDVFYVGGTSMAPTGTKLRTINMATTAGDVFGNVNGGMGNGGANADAIGVFAQAASTIDSSSVPVDAIFWGSGLGTAIVSGGTAGYTLPVNDRYNGGLLNASSYLIANSVQGSSFRATGSFNRTTGVYTPRTWTINTSFTDGTSAVAVVNSNSYSWSNGATTQDISGLTAGTYSVTATNPVGCTATLNVTIHQPNDLVVLGFSPVSGNSGTSVTIAGFGFDGVDQVLFNGTAATFTVLNDSQLIATAPVGVTTGSITLINDGCDTTVSSTPFTVTVASATLNLTLLIEGMYDGAGGLVPALLNGGVGTSSTECDTIHVELRDQTSPTTVLGSGTVVLGTNGQASLSMPSGVIGATGYIAVFHRNAVETWSDLVTFSATTNYDFTTAATQAYGSNQKEVTPGVWAFYSGDLSPQDGLIDVTDQGLIDNDIFNFVSGYVVTDITGDNLVDVTDQGIVDNNIFNFIGSMHP
ncbi:MAG: hypothetical protein U0Y08_12615 [Bacteroidia bacterium]